MILGPVTPKSETIKSNTGKERGMFSNLKIKKKDKIIISVEIVMLLKIDIISYIDAYLQIP